MITVAVCEGGREDRQAERKVSIWEYLAIWAVVVVVAEFIEYLAHRGYVIVDRN